MGSENSKEAPPDGRGEDQGSDRPNRDFQRGMPVLKCTTNCDPTALEPPSVKEAESEATTILWKLDNFKSILTMRGTPSSDAKWVTVASKNVHLGKSIGLPSEWSLGIRKTVDHSGAQLMFFLSFLGGPEGVKIRAGCSIIISDSVTRGVAAHEYKIGREDNGCWFPQSNDPSLTLDVLELVIVVRIYKETNRNGNSPNVQLPAKVTWPRDLIMNLFLEPEATEADLTLRFTKNGNKERRAHRNILAAGNPVFRAMFNSDMDEAKSGVVVIEDISYDVMEIILDCIYTGRTPEDIPALDDNPMMTNYAKELVYGAEKYGLASLKEFCDQNLIRVCSAGNAMELLNLAMLHKLTQATLDICDFIKTIA